MSYTVLSNDEKILYNCFVIVNKKYNNVKFTLTNCKMIFEVKKGIFKKKFKVIDSVFIKDIKIIKDDVQVKRNKLSVCIQTINKTIVFSCMNDNDAKNIVRELIDASTGTNGIERLKNKIDKIKEIVDKTSKIISIVGSITLGIASIVNKKK